MIVPHKPLFDADNLTESSFLRQQVAGIVFHTLAACVVAFFLDLSHSREKVSLSIFLFERYFTVLYLMYNHVIVRICVLKFLAISKITYTMV